MFQCTLCIRKITCDNEVVTTFCGHVFHQNCFNVHLNKSKQCPICQKSLKVSIALLQELSHGLAILPLHLEECQSTGAGHNQNKQTMSVMHENVLLRQRIVELTRHIFISQANVERRSSWKSETIHNNEQLSFKDNKTNSKDELNPHLVTVKNNYNLNQLQSKTTWSIIHNSILESSPEKDRVLRSKRREYLTWRNKAQSWLSKMKRASDKLLAAEACFTQPEYREQLLLFHKKLSLQGKIIETAKRAGLIYLVIGSMSEDDKEIIHVSMNHLGVVYDDIAERITNRMEKTTLASSNSIIVHHITEGQAIRQRETSGLPGSLYTPSPDSDCRPVLLPNRKCHYTNTILTPPLILMDYHEPIFV